MARRAAPSPAVAVAVAVAVVAVLGPDDVLVM
jgi:hypothetical protein